VVSRERPERVATIVTMQWPKRLHPRSMKLATFPSSSLCSCCCLDVHNFTSVALVEGLCDASFRQGIDRLSLLLEYELSSKLSDDVILFGSQIYYTHSTSPWKWEVFVAPGVYLIDEPALALGSIFGRRVSVSILRKLYSR
jgi:hypothetical protein